MRFQRMTFLKTLALMLGMTVAAQAVTIQNPEHVLEDGTAFVFVEAESVLRVESEDPATGYLVVDKNNPIKSNPDAVKGNLDILPADTNASRGGGLLDQLGGPRFDTATWEVQFSTPATYYLYVHATIYNSDANTSYGNEDSFYLPPDFNMNPREDWIGFEGETQDGIPMVGDTDQDGWMPVFNNKWVISGGTTETHNNTDEDFWDGQFHWFYADYAVESDENGKYVDDYGMAIKYEITEDELNTPLEFTIGTREHYSVIDGFLFTTNPELLNELAQEEMDPLFLNLPGGGLTGDFDGDGQLSALDINQLTMESAAGSNQAAYDLNNDLLVNGDDVKVWIRDLKKSWVGDANLDGEFNTSDLVAVLGSGTYEQDVPSDWSSGDFNGDGRTNTSDLVAALADGGYEGGPRAAVAAVPEPGSMLLLSLASLGLLKFRRR
ncbi:MAG: PEP-CTERM sorting domain-containing protein [Planctomycetales bacterium]|nr:PEP-CTERM sorting domain-containing protein [Planctomycetales bacterium]MCA9168496.1 PEP-CTERM sorting domain-containing protein [Planctomycetales bacterium]